MLGNRTRAQFIQAQRDGIGRQFIKQHRSPSGFRRERDRKGLCDEVLPSGLHEHIEKVADCGSERLQMKSVRFVLRIEWSNPDQASGIPEREGDRLPRSECAVPREKPPGRLKRGAPRTPFPQQPPRLFDGQQLRNAPHDDCVDHAAWPG